MLSLCYLTCTEHHWRRRVENRDEYRESEKGGNGKGQEKGASRKFPNGNAHNRHTGKERFYLEFCKK